MIIRLVKLTIKNEHKEDFEKIFLKYQESIAAQPGCNRVILQKDISGNGVYFTQSEWDSENDLNNYRKSELFGVVWPTVKPWFNNKPEAWSTIKL